MTDFVVLKKYDIREFRKIKRKLGKKQRCCASVTSFLSYEDVPWKRCSRILSLAFSPFNVFSSMSSLPGGGGWRGALGSIFGTYESREGNYQKYWVGVCGPLPKSLGSIYDQELRFFWPYLWRKSEIFPALFRTWPNISYPIYDLRLY